MSKTALLEKAFEKAAELPEQEQNEFAGFLISELEEEKKWAESFEKYPEVLEKLGQKALKDHREGKTEPLNPDKL